MATISVDRRTWVLSSNSQALGRLDLFSKQNSGSADIIFAPAFKITRELQYGSRRFHLREPIEVGVEFHDGLWIHKATAFSILAYAPTRRESLNSLCMDFAALWDHIALEEDANLTEDAR